MTLRHIRIFLAVCDHGFNTTRAAEALHMTQPAVSLAIREMEEYYGVALFDRIGRRLRITEAGRRMQDYGTRIGVLFDDMEKDMRDWNCMGVLRLGSSVTIGGQFLPEYVTRFHQQYPGIEVRVTVEQSELLEQKVGKNTLDFALIEGRTHSPDLIVQPFMEDSLAVIASPAGPYPAGQTLTQEQFGQAPLLLRERGSGTRETFEQAISQAGLSVTPLWEATSNTVLINAVARGLGLAVLSWRVAARALESGQVAEVFVEGLDLRRQFRIIYHKDKLLTPPARAFMALCRQGA